MPAKSGILLLLSMRFDCQSDQCRLEKGTCQLGYIDGFDSQWSLLFQLDVNAIRRLSLDGQHVYGFLFSNFDFALVHV